MQIILSINLILLENSYIQSCNKLKLNRSNILIAIVILFSNFAKTIK